MIRLDVDPSNPGQFFACCGLLELAARLDITARARFEGRSFIIACDLTLAAILAPLTGRPLVQVDEDDNASSPIHVPGPFDLRLDWWKDEEAGGRELKVWAGTMQSLRIAQAMIASLRDEQLHDERLLDHGCVVYDPVDPSKKVEPFYFDARRAPNAHSRDVGFSPNDLDLTTTAFPAVEGLALIGLQRFRPRAKQRRVYDYSAWAQDLPVAVAAAVACRAVLVAPSRTYRFECWYRTGQKKHKAFRPAVLIEGGI